MPSFVRGKWDAPHWVSCSGALRAGTAAAEQRTDGLQQHGADNWLAQEDAVGNPGRLLPRAVLVLAHDEDRRPSEPEEGGGAPPLSFALRSFRVDRVRLVGQTVLPIPWLVESETSPPEPDYDGSG